MLYASTLTKILPGSPQYILVSRDRAEISTLSMAARLWSEVQEWNEGYYSRTTNTQNSQVID